MKHFIAHVLQAIVDVELEKSRSARAMPRRCIHNLASRFGPMDIIVSCRHSTALLLRFATDESARLPTLRRILIAGHVSAETAQAFAAELCGCAFDLTRASALALRINAAIAAYMHRQLEADYPMLNFTQRARMLTPAWSDV